MTEGDPFWDTIRDELLGKPSEELKECHKPKPILLPTGEVKCFGSPSSISTFFLFLYECLSIEQ